MTKKAELDRHSIVDIDSVDEKELFNLKKEDDRWWSDALSRVNSLSEPLKKDKEIS